MLANSIARGYGRGSRFKYSKKPISRVSDEADALFAETQVDVRTYGRMVELCMEVLQEVVHGTGQHAVSGSDRCDISA